MIVDKIRHFMKREEAGGIVLIFATILALIFANSPLSGIYTYILKEKDLTHWINDGLMAVFFFLVSLEIKREMVEGKLSTIHSALMPLIAAIGGILVPTALFLLINSAHPENWRGWAIPTATDIAFSLGLLALLGSRIPSSLKILLTAIAVIDDLAAIAIIAVFYTSEIHLLMLFIAFLMLALMGVMNFLHVKRLEMYLMAGFLMWAALLTSGVHPTMAGVACAFCIPFSRKALHPGKIDALIHDIHPFAAFFILPVFAFANAGVSLAGISMEDILSPLTLGIIAGLVAGKTLGVSLTLLLLRLNEKFRRQSDDLTATHIIGLGLCCGLGFTMSLFIGDLAFTDADAQTAARLGVLLASFIAAAGAYIILRCGTKK